ncbi:leucine-rich repeat and coiled-coil domain-containing protein 1-like [Pseudonaja textilis]|uniref:leucine-rich repeat and coiled-coil domain-containing protein 1-like n=1 Tax=Pseudonaja textilis TaxID=8673 RepID=UPI000EA9ADB9|nr:leucine-rich repeat and coiled-coil domain-containing protein 1-like [Pseudonaja textilis]
MAEVCATSGELSLMDKGIKSLAELPLSSELHTLNLHCNLIARIESLDHLLNLEHLDLSSNRIHWIEGLSCLANLRTLNLACNLITKVEGLEKLYNLTKLNLSYNRIDDLSGLLHLRGPNYKINHIELHSNSVNNVNHLLQCLCGLQYLTNLTLEKNEKSNPVCAKIGYREILLQALPQLTILDGKNIFGEPVNLMEPNSSDLKCLEDFLSCLVSSSYTDEEETYVNLPIITPRIDQVLARFRQRAKMSPWTTTSSSTEIMSSFEPEKIKFDNDSRIKRLEEQISHLLQKVTNSSKADVTVKAKKETDFTSESGSESGKENRKATKRSKLPNYRKNTLSTKLRSQRGKLSAREQEKDFIKSKFQKSHIKEGQSSSPASEIASLKVVGETPEKLGGPKSQLKKLNVDTGIQEEFTYRVLIQELDQEREKRWKAEQAEKKLSESIKQLQNQAKEEKDIQSLAVYTTDRLRELILKERNAKTRLQADIRQLKDEAEKLGKELERSKQKEEDQQKALRALEEALSKLESQKAQQQASEMKRIQTAELKASAAEREVQLLRICLQQQKEKVEQVHELLTLREQEHRGVGAGCNTKEVVERLRYLEAEIEELEIKEKELDQQKLWLQQSIKNVKEDSINKRFSYITHEDICDCFSGDTLLAIQAPSGTQLEVPVPHVGQKKYQINLKSSLGPIHVLLINKESSSSKPVVFPVPPPDDLLQSAVPLTSPKPNQRLQEPSDLNQKQSLPQTPVTDIPTEINLQGSQAPETLCASIPDSELYDSLVTETTPSSTILPSFLPLDVNSILKSNTFDIAKMDEPGGVNSDIIDELMSSDVFPLLRLSPTPGDDYSFNLDDNEGVCDLFDVQILNY